MNIVGLVDVVDQRINARIIELLISKRTMKFSTGDREIVRQFPLPLGCTRLYLLERPRAAVLICLETISFPCKYIDKEEFRQIFLRKPSIWVFKSIV